MRRWILAMGVVVSMAAVGQAQQPVVVHAQLTAKAAEHGLAAELDAAKQGAGPVWGGLVDPAQRAVIIGLGLRSSGAAGGEW